MATRQGPVGSPPFSGSGEDVPSGSKAQYYREQATRLREAATKAKAPEARTEMLRTAAEYDKLAEAVERRQKRDDQ
jgi:hypothetical protein